MIDKPLDAVEIVADHLAVKFNMAGQGTDAHSIDLGTEAIVGLQRACGWDGEGPEPAIVILPGKELYGGTALRDVDDVPHAVVIVPPLTEEVFNG